MREAAVALLGVDAVDRLRTPRNEPQRGAAVRIAAPGVEHVFGVLRRVAHGKAVEFVGVDVAVAVEKGGGNLLAHGLGKGHALAHAKDLVAAAVEAQFFHVQLHDGLKDAAAFLDLAPLRLGRRRALIEPAPVHVGQAGADAGEVAVALVGFHPEYIVHDVVGFVHQLDDLPGLVATVELFHLGQGHHQTHGISHNTLVCLQVAQEILLLCNAICRGANQMLPLRELQPAYMRSSSGGMEPPACPCTSPSSMRASARRLKKRSTSGLLP